jgi:hypothetical protein
MSLPPSPSSTAVRRARNTCQFKAPVLTHDPRPRNHTAPSPPHTLRDQSPATLKQAKVTRCCCSSDWCTRSQSLPAMVRLYCLPKRSFRFFAFGRIVSVCPMGIFVSVVCRGDGLATISRQRMRWGHCLVPKSPGVRGEESNVSGPFRGDTGVGRTQMTVVTGLSTKRLLQTQVRTPRMKLWGNEQGLQSQSVSSESVTWLTMGTINYTRLSADRGFHLDGPRVRRVV